MSRSSRIYRRNSHLIRRCQMYRRLFFGENLRLKRLKKGIRGENWTKSRLSERSANSLCIDVPRRSHYGTGQKRYYDNRLTDLVSDQQTECDALYDQYGQPYHISRPRTLPSGGLQTPKANKGDRCLFGATKHIPNTPLL